MNRAIYNKQFNALLKRMEQRFAPRVYKALRLVHKDAARLVERQGAAYTQVSISMQDINMRLIPVIQSIYRDAGLYMANRTLSMLRKERQVKSFGFNEEWVQQIQDYFERYLLDRSVLPISETTKERILYILSEGIEQGWGVKKMVRALNDIPAIRNRTERIVRTESVRAANYGVFIGADKYDFEVVKEWISATDKRTRHTHRVNHREQREVDQSFSNGLMFPGDPEGPAKEVINCRCRIVVVPKRNEAGRLIPKRRSLATVLAA